MVTSRKIVLKFRPQDRNRRRWLKWHRESGEYYGLYNWQQNYSERMWRKMKWPGYYRIGHHLQYLAQHAPKNIRVKWLPAWRRFVKRYSKY